MHQSLARGVVDCAITGPSSANSAGWPEVSAYAVPIAFRLAMNGYGIRFEAWSRLSPEDQTKLPAGSDSLFEEIRACSGAPVDDALRCNVCATAFQTDTTCDLELIEITETDRSLIANAAKDISFPTWAEIFDKTDPGCSEARQRRADALATPPIWRQAFGSARCACSR